MALWHTPPARTLFPHLSVQSTSSRLVSRLSNVANGDVIQFQFLEKNHTVTQSTFAAPCSNVTSTTGEVTGVDSGFQFVNSTTEFPVWQITINNASAPLWFYCRQAKCVIPPPRAVQILCVLTAAPCAHS